MAQHKNRNWTKLDKKNQLTASTNSELYVESEEPNSAIRQTGVGAVQSTEKTTKLDGHPAGC